MRVYGAAVDARAARSRPEILAMAATAEVNAAWFALDGLWKPLIFLTNCRDAARISSSVTGGSKLNSVLMFLHIPLCLLTRVKIPAENSFYVCAQRNAMN